MLEKNPNSAAIKAVLERFDEVVDTAPVESFGVTERRQQTEREWAAKCSDFRTLIERALGLPGWSPLMSLNLTDLQKIALSYLEGYPDSAFIDAFIADRHAQIDFPIESDEPIPKQYVSLQKRKLRLRSYLIESLARIDQEVNALRKKCPHPNDLYVPDPSGNNDSYYLCEDCGRER